MSNEEDVSAPASTAQDAAASTDESLAPDEHGHVTVHVVHVNETEKAHFKESIHATLQAVWDKSYVELHIDRRPKDIFQTGGKHPKSLMSHLGLTLKQALEQNVIHNFHFGIVSETGGA
jgi:hypothetical protein